MKFPKSNYNYCEHNSIEQLQMPPIDFWPIYSWGWMGEITDEGIVARLDEMVKRGIRRVYVLPLPSEFSGIQHKSETKYLSDKYFKRMDFLINETGKRGMKLWLYDESGWPSGAANGEVVRNNLELEAFSIDSKGKIHLIPPLAQPYPDLLNKKSTNKFIEYTHQKYKDYFKDTFGENFSAIFTDEPHVRTDDENLPWTENFEEIFKKKFGYDISEYFPGLFNEELTDEMSRKVRADYRDLLGELFAENYFLPIKDWCEKNGILSTGHVGGEDVAFGNAKWGYYHILRCLRAMNIPGVDMIWRQAFPGPKMPGIEPYAPLCANSLFPRYASSAAHQTGARLALTESYAIYGAGITYDQMRWVYNFQVVRGINVLNPMNMSYTHKGKYATQAGLPNFSSPAPGCADLKDFNLWASRASYVTSAGKPVSDSAIYMPFRDIWPADTQARKTAEAFEELGAELERCGCDIDVIDDDAIIESSIVDGALCIGDAKYHTLYFQDGISVCDKVRDKLELFGNNGGNIVSCVGDFETYPIIKDENKYLRATRRIIDEGTLYYVTNEAFEAKSGEVTFPFEVAKTAFEIDLLTGARKAVSVTPYKYNLSLGGEIALLFTPDNPSLTETKKIKPQNSISLTNFDFCVKKEIRIVEEGIVEKNLLKENIKINLGDWRHITGQFFSGDAEYKTSFVFENEIPQKAILDLGLVAYTCEVFLNGKSLGTKVFSPFLYELSGIERENELTIRVSNTMANAYAGAKYEEWIPDYKPDYMKRLEMDFEKESLPSGLFGPVVLKW